MAGEGGGEFNSVGCSPSFHIENIERLVFSVISVLLFSPHNTLSQFISESLSPTY